jgi:hypothetical protein
MLTTRNAPSPSHQLLLKTFLSLVMALCTGASGHAQEQELFPLSQVRSGMQGYAYTIFSGDKVEKFDLEVIGVMDNFLGPKQSIILVELKGPKLEHTGVVAGMSGSPVYFEGKLAGALSLKIGMFSKDAIAGVTPIQDVLNAVAQPGLGQISRQALALPSETSSRFGLASGAALEPIESPLVFSGIHPLAIQQFAKDLQGYGFVAAQGSTTPPRPDDAQLKAGEMAGMVFVRGDASINSACTVTAVRGDQVFLCGHPLMSLGELQMPMARSRVVTTLSSSLASTKIVSVGGLIGTITGDHLTAVTGKLGPIPRMIPMDLTLLSHGRETKLHFELMDQAKLTPLLVAITTLSGVTQNAIYGEGTTLHFSGDIHLIGHGPVHVENTIAPGDSLAADGFPIAIVMQNVFSRIYNNFFEPAKVDHISVRVEASQGRTSFNIESAWLEKGEAAPGENLRIRVLVRPYRGPSRVEEATIHIPEQFARGTTLRVLVSEAEILNRSARGFGFPGAGGGGSPAGLDQIIALLNRERRNDRLYVGLFAPTPTLLWDDKELPNIPLSQINMLDGRPTPGTVQLLRESLVHESSIPLGGPVSGAISLNLQIR